MSAYFFTPLFFTRPLRWPRVSKPMTTDCERPLALATPNMRQRNKSGYWQVAQTRR
ncbi:hypothetical protein [Parvibium lacunae]|uniref:hypothetical protein n=1 Tax=Parvibium lacunae TaxID=1888893 RepID=UPI001314DEE5|nr:hypothetical protein [Parvibium lacunae]